MKRSSISPVARALLFLLLEAGAVFFRSWFFSFGGQRIPRENALFAGLITCLIAVAGALVILSIYHPPVKDGPPVSRPPDGMDPVLFYALLTGQIRVEYLPFSILPYVRDGYAVLEIVEQKNYSTKFRLKKLKDLPFGTPRYIRRLFAAMCLEEEAGGEEIVLDFRRYLASLNLIGERGQTVIDLILMILLMTAAGGYAVTACGAHTGIVSLPVFLLCLLPESGYMIMMEQAGYRPGSSFRIGAVLTAALLTVPVLGGFASAPLSAAAFLSFAAVSAARGNSVFLTPAGEREAAKATAFAAFLTRPKTVYFRGGGDVFYENAPYAMILDAFPVWSRAFRKSHIEPPEWCEYKGADPFRPEMVLVPFKLFGFSLA